MHELVRDRHSRPNRESRQVYLIPNVAVRVQYFVTYSELLASHLGLLIYAEQYVMQNQIPELIHVQFLNSIYKILKRFGKLRCMEPYKQVHDM